VSEESSGDTETGRIEALRLYGMLDTPPDGTLDAITSLAALLLKAPVALISLVDVDRIWFKSRVGMEISEIVRRPGLCSSAIEVEGVYVVSDAATDPRVSDNPLAAGEFRFRFYAAAPLRTSGGYQLGTLCVLDRDPREADPEDLALLETLAGLVMEQMELRFATRQLEARNQALAARVAELEAGQDEAARLAATAAHDMRNSLSSTMLMARLVLEEKLGPLNPRQRQMVESICGSSDELLRLIKDLLEPQE
jgi:GAF domain-containing protein